MTYDDLDRGFASAARAAAMATALSLGFGLTSAVAGDQIQTPSPAMTPAPTGEFDNSCAMGFASGQVVKTDCSVNWTAPDGKVYCFSTAESKATFLKNPDENIQKAKEFFLAESLTQDQGSASAQPAAEEGGLVKPTKEFTESDVDAAVKQTIAERSKDGVFVFHDPKLDTDLNLVFDKIGIVRGMEGYGWFANIIFHDKDVPKSNMPSTSGTSRRAIS
jgi:YHS domain-containing protein